MQTFAESVSDIDACIVYSPRLYGQLLLSFSQKIDFLDIIICSGSGRGFLTGRISFLSSTVNAVKELQSLRTELHHEKDTI